MCACMYAIRPFRSCTRVPHIYQHVQCTTQVMKGKDKNGKDINYLIIDTEVRFLIALS